MRKCHNHKFVKTIHLGLDQLCWKSFAPTGSFNQRTTYVTICSRHSLDKKVKKSTCFPLAKLFPKLGMCSDLRNVVVLLRICALLSFSQSHLWKKFVAVQQTMKQIIFISTSSLSLPWPQVGCRPSLNFKRSSLLSFFAAIGLLLCCTSSTMTQSNSGLFSCRSEIHIRIYMDATF